MTDTTQAAHSVFTATSAFSLAAVAGMAIVATTAARKLLPKNAPWQDRCTFIWLVRTVPRYTPSSQTIPCFHADITSNRRPAMINPTSNVPTTKKPPSIQTFDALIHFIFEGSFIALSTFGRTVDTSSGIFAELCAFTCFFILSGRLFLRVYLFIFLFSFSHLTPYIYRA